MNKVELLKEYLEREYHNLYCFKQGSPERSEHSKKISLLEEMIKIFSVPDFAGLPLLDGSEYYADSDSIREWGQAYPGLILKEQFWLMRAWLIANPGKRKNKVSILRFVNTWLSYENKHIAERNKAEIHIKPGPQNNFTQENPDFDKIMEDQIKKQRGEI